MTELLNQMERPDSSGAQVQTFPLIDAHVHLQFFDGNVLMKDGHPTPSLKQVIEDAQNAGIRHFVCNATCENDWQKVIDISQQYPGVHVALGIHPWYMHTLKPGWDERLEALLSKNSTFMVGEIGLDTRKSDMYMHTPTAGYQFRPDSEQVRDMWTQTNVFRRQLELAHKYNRPAMVHCGKKNWDKMKTALQLQKEVMPPCIVSHSHHGDANLTKYLAKEYNAYFSFSPLITWENCIKVRAGLQYVLENCPDRLLFESDAYSNISDTPANGVTATENKTFEMAQQLGLNKITSHEALREIAFQNLKRILTR